MKYDEQQLKINAAANRLELEVEGNIAFIDYKLKRDLLFLVHTEVPAELEGKGVGSAIVQKALQHAKTHNYKVVPMCSFVQSYMKRHKEWDSLLANNWERFVD